MHHRNSCLTVAAMMTVSIMAAQMACVKGPSVADQDPGLSEKRIITLTLANFDSAIASDYRLALIEFYSPWCHTCIEFAPVFDSLARRLPSTVLMGKVDVTVETALTNTHQIEWWPTVLFIRRGTEVMRVTGINTVEYYAGLVDSLLRQP